MCRGEPYSILGNMEETVPFVKVYVQAGVECRTQQLKNNTFIHNFQKTKDL